MKNLGSTNSLALRSMRLTALAIAAAAAAVAAGTLAGAGNAAPARTAGKASHSQKKQIKQPTLENGLLTVEGTNEGDRIALRLQAGQPGVLQVDFGDDGSPEFSFERTQIAQIVVEAGNGGDAVRIDESNGAFSGTIPTTLEGGNGNDMLAGGAGDGTLDGGNGHDTLAGGNGNETLLGGNGNDSIDGNKGNDAAFLGNGDDMFIWDPGDGSDTIEGENGNDTMLFNGANVVDTVDLVADGSHLKFFRQPANITMDTHGVERVDFNALGLADVVTVNDLTGTGVKELNIDLAGSLGGTTGDAAADRVVVNATNGNDKVHVSGSAGVEVSGLVPTVRIFHSEAEAANDRLEINTLAGTDTVKSASLDGGLIQLFVDGALVP
jgi:Ca2+-binding RTX toxin-like protein